MLESDVCWITFFDSPCDRTMGVVHKMFEIRCWVGSELFMRGVSGTFIAAPTARVSAHSLFFAFKRVCFPS